MAMLAADRDVVVVFVTRVLIASSVRIRILFQRQFFHRAKLPTQRQQPMHLLDILLSFWQRVTVRHLRSVDQVVAVVIVEQQQRQKQASRQSHEEWSTSSASFWQMNESAVCVSMVVGNATAATAASAATASYYRHTQWTDDYVPQSYTVRRSITLLVYISVYIHIYSCVIIRRYIVRRYQYNSHNTFPLYTVAYFIYT